MDFEEFKEQIAKDLKEVLYSRFGMDASVEQRAVEKLNSAYDALTVKPEGCEIGVSMNLDTLYAAYRNGEAYDVVLNKAAELADGSLRNKPEFNIESIMNYDVMKETLVMEVVSADRNADFLKNIPHKNIEDLAVVYRFQVCGMEDGHGTILVTNDLLDKYGITAEQLHADALEKAPEIQPIVFEGMAEVLARQMGVENVEMLGLNVPPEEEQMIVVSVEGNVHGAGVLAYRDFCEKASERVGNQSFFLLPSSIHELLIIPDNGKFDVPSLEMMVKEVNATTVDPAEQLTDNVYHYDAEAKIFERGDKFVQRQQAKEAGIDMGEPNVDKDGIKGEIVNEKAHEAKSEVQGEKKSLIADLKAKKEQIASAPKKENTPEIKPKAKGGDAR